MSTISVADSPVGRTTGDRGSYDGRGPRGRPAGGGVRRKRSLLPPGGVPTDGAGRPAGPRAPGSHAALGRRWMPWGTNVTPGARLFAVAALALSLLGLLYVIQISHVARIGYRLSDIQGRQAALDREQELLLHRLNAERTLARVSDVAQREYGMRPLAGTGLAGATTAAGAKPTAGPRHRFLTVQRPPVVAPRPDRTRGTDLGLVDRLWNRIVGVGVARAD